MSASLLWSRWGCSRGQATYRGPTRPAHKAAGTRSRSYGKGSPPFLTYVPNPGFAGTLSVVGNDPGAYGYYGISGTSNIAQNFSLDEGWHRFVFEVDRTGYAAWYRDGLLRAQAFDFPLGGLFGVTFTGGIQAHRLDNIRFENDL